MHDEFDDEDDFALRITGGKLLHSGIAGSEPGPADYALPPGIPALQDMDLDETCLGAQISTGHDAPPTNANRANQYMVLAAGALGAMVLVCGILVGWVLTRSSSPASTPLLVAAGQRPIVDTELNRWAKTLAGASMHDLWENRVAFLLVVEAQPEVEEALWKGVGRLLLLARCSHTNSEKEILRVLRVMESKTAPPTLRQLAVTLKPDLAAREGQK